MHPDEAALLAERDRLKYCHPDGPTFRLNDFPAEPLYTLFIGDDPIGDLDDFPTAWTR